MANSVFRGNRPSSLAGSYQDKYESGTTFLRNYISASIYSGNTEIIQTLERAILYWKFYNNQHWKKNNDKLLSFNYIRAIIDKVNNFISGNKGITFNIKDTYFEEPEEDKERAMESAVMSVWKENGMRKFIKDALLTGSVTGNTYIYIYVDNNRRIKLLLLDSRYTVPVFNNGDRDDIIAYDVIKPLAYNEKEYVRKVTRYSVGRRETYYQKSTEPGAERYEYIEVETGLNFIPIVHIENISSPDRYGGRSDIEDVIKLNKTYNEMAEDLRKIIAYYATPTTVITGGSVSQLVRGLGQIWSGLSADANVFNLSLNEDLSASQNFLTLIKDSIHTLTGVPEEILSKVVHISNTSAAALQMLYQPIIQVSDNKTIGYIEGFERVNEIIVEFGIRFTPDNPLFSKLIDVFGDDYSSIIERYKAEPVFNYGLPADRLMELNEIAIELNQGIGSRREVMERLGKTNIPELMDEINADDVRKMTVIPEVERELNSEDPKEDPETAAEKDEKMLEKKKKRQ